MEILETAGLQVFLDSDQVEAGQVWDSTVADGYWIGTVLEGAVTVVQDPFGRRSWRHGASAFFHARDPFLTRHVAMAHGALSAVFLRLPAGVAEDVMGPDGVAALERMARRGVGACGPALAGICWQMRACTLTGAARRLYLSGKALEILSLAIEDGDDAGPRPAPSGWAVRDIERFHEARAILLAELHDPPSVADLARRVGTNTRKLGDGFRDLFGQPVYAFVKGRRLDEAKRLLEAGEPSIAHLARRFGYQPAHFATEFRRRFGVAPTALVGRRRVALQDPECL